MLLNANKTKVLNISISETIYLTDEVLISGTHLETVE